MLNYSDCMNTTVDVAGNEKFKSDKRRLAGLWLVMSLSVLIYPFARVAPYINGNGMTVNRGIPLAFLIANLITLSIGIKSTTMSFASLVFDYSTPRMTFWFLVCEQVLWFPYLMDMIIVGDLTATGQLVPKLYNPSSGDISFVGAMGIIGAGTFCLFFFGGLVFFGHAHLSYQMGMPHNGAYYRSGLVFSSAVMVLAGLAQLMLGSYIINNIGHGPLQEPIAVAMFIVYFPEISVTVGLIYILNGFYGVYRGLSGPATDYYFQYSMWVQWLFTLVLMILTQTAYAPGSDFAEVAPTLVALTFGLHAIPAFMDFMGRVMPDDMMGHYGNFLEKVAGLLVDDPVATKEQDNAAAERAEAIDA